MLKTIISTILVLWFPLGQAERYLDTVPVFWQSLYPHGGEGLYCGKRFDRYDRRYNIEHVFPMAWVTRSLGCGSRARCRDRSERFNRIESDMHNLYPADAELNQARGAMAYAELAGEQWVREDCDLEIDQRRRLVEPREAVRGDIARSMLYMAATYPELRLFPRQRDLMERWHLADPVSEAERQRNRVILRLQGRANPWIE